MGILVTSHPPEVDQRAVGQLEDHLQLLGKLHIELFVYLRVMKQQTYGFA